MTGAYTIFKRELFSLFVTPLAWAVLASFLLIQGLHFYVVFSNFATQSALQIDAGPAQVFFGQTVIIYPLLFLICPLLTMRLLAEERRSGTIEPLLTTPIGSAAVVLGKYAAVLSLYVMMWAPTVLYMVLASDAGPIDWQVVATGYLAAFGVGASYLAIGIMMSAFATSQLTAAILSAAVLMGLFVLGIGQFVFPEGPMRELCRHVSVWGQLNEFSRGIVDSRRLVFNATAVVLPLFIAIRAVDSWRVE